MVLWLSKDLGFSDQARGRDGRLGLGAGHDGLHVARRFAHRRDRFAAHIFPWRRICTVARTVMVTTTIPWLALICGVLPLAVGEALGTPVLLAATRRYSTTAQRSISFSIIYVVMNVGYFAAGYIFDFVRQLDLHFDLLWLRANNAPAAFLR